MQHLQSLSSKWRFSLPRLLGTQRDPSFTQDEVRRRLRGRDSGCARTAAVHAAAARTAVWSALLPDDIASDLGAAARKLPSVVFWHSQGISLEDIGRRISPLGGAWDADRALDTASALIAYVLNEPGFIDRLAA
jgi:hypothetical protein